MNHRSTRYGLLALFLAACALPSAPPVAPALESIHTIAVFPPNNRTGDPLLIAGASFAEKYVLPTERYTVSDALAVEARTQLARHGINTIPTELVDAAIAVQPPSSAQDAAAVAARNHFEGTVMYIEIKRWEADVPYHPTFVIASVTITLLDPSTGSVVWSADHPSRPVPTPGVISLGDAYSVAAHTLVTELLAPLVAERSAS
jgi:hypothetical protein